jgi:peptidoglycan/LPS O-acetylase OafA/YrhL
VRPAGSSGEGQLARPPYRPDIDGLRAVAVIMVIAYHAFPKYVPGGFVGVDVFFVISGYLITQLILSGLQEGSFSLAGFYERRVRRIIPALLVVLAACVVVGWFTLLPGEFRWLGRSLAWSTPFLANVFFGHYTAYFGPDADANVLLHLWSLGVEEQFYLIWPPLLMLAAAHGLAMRVLGAVMATSLGISVWGAWHAPDIHFYLPGARAWELALGGTLAAWQLSGAHRSIFRSLPASRRWHGGVQVASLSGLGLLAGGGVLLSTGNAFPGILGVVPTLGAALLIWSGTGALVNRRLLSLGPMIFIGKMSYSLYLWHWPLFAFARIIFGRDLPPATVVVIVVLAFAAAWLTYRQVEVPLRSGRGGPRAVPALLGGLVGFTALGAAMAAQWIPGRLAGPAFTSWEAALVDWQYSGETHVDTRSGFPTLRARSYRAATALFIGDSHMQQYWPRVTQVIETHPEAARSALFAAYSACLPLPGIESLQHECDALFTYAAGLAFQPDVDTVVFGACWECYLLREYSGHHWQGVYRADDPTHTLLRLGSPGTQIAFAQFERLVTRLVSSGRRVFIVLSNPTSPMFNPPSRIPARVRLSLHVPDTLVADAEPVDAAHFEMSVAPVMDRLRQIAARTGAQVLDPRSSLCEGMSCAALGTDGAPLYIDATHLRAAFARERASFLDETLLGSPMR